MDQVSDIQAVTTNKALLNEDSHTVDHTVLNNLDQLYGQHVIAQMTKKPEFSFLITHYDLLYQSIIPNPQLTISTLCHHTTISKSVAQYITDGSNPRVRCQRVVNFLLVKLENDGDYIQFCFQLSTISILTNLPDKLITEFHKNGRWTKNLSTMNPNLTKSSIHCIPNDCGLRDSSISNDSSSSIILDACNIAESILAESSILKCTDEREWPSVANSCSISKHYQLNERRYHTLQRTIPSTPTFASGIQLLRSKYDAVLQSLPTDYGRTLQAVQDHLTDEQICAVLGSSNHSSANKVLLDVLTDKVQSTEDLLELCSQLEKILSLLSDTTVLANLIGDLRKCCDQQVDSNVVTSPCSNFSSDTTNHLGNLATSPDVELVRPKYDAILQSLPIDYEKTLQAIQDHLTDEQMCSVLSNSNYTSANKVILNCLVENMSSRGNLLLLCEYLQKIVPLSHDPESLTSTLNVLRAEFQQKSTSSSATGSNQLSSNPQLSNVPVRPPIAVDLYQHVFSTIQLNPKALTLLRLNYTGLCDCLPQDYLRTVQVMMKYLPMPDAIMHHLTMLPSMELVNENIVGNAMVVMLKSDKDILKFFKMMKEVVNTTKGREFIETLQNELMKTVDPLYVPTKDGADATVNIALFNNSDYSSFTELHKISASHQQSQDLPEASKSSAVRNTMQHILTEGTEFNRDGERPQMSELYKDVAPKCAIYWEELGTKLGLQQHEIAIISKNNDYNSNRALDCSKSMLRKWLEIDTEATWGKLKDAIAAMNKQGLKYIKPPKLPTNIVHRPKLLEEMVDKICNACLNIDCYATTLTVTGAGGFGKTTLVTALCHHPTVQHQFTNGFVFVQLGPQSSDPSEKLCQLYHLLTGQQLNAGDTNYAEQEIQQLVEAHYQNLLVIIDDVWHVEDADPIVRAFGCCKTVLTTRMNDIEQHIPTAETINIGPMETGEAIILLTNGVADCNTLSHEDTNLLDELAQETHSWPLLLSLIRGHLFHGVKKRNKSIHDAIHSVRVKLHEKGLTAFDNNNLKGKGGKEKESSRTFAAKVCIEITLALLSQNQPNNFKSLILSTGVGNSLPMQVLHYLWNVSEMEAEDEVNTLWGYGLVTFVDTIIPPNNKLQPCVEVHAVISQFIIENIDSDQVFRLSPYGGLGTANVLKHGLEVSFQQSYGICDITTLYLKPAEYLKYTRSKVECDLLPYYLKKIDMRRIFELHFITSKIHAIQDALQSPIITQGVSALFEEQTTPLKVECVKLLRHVHKLSRELKQVIQRHLMDGNYTVLIDAVEDKCFNSPIGKLAQTTVAAIRGIISHCEPQQLSIITRSCEYLQRITPDFDIISHKIVPYIKLHIELHQKITSALRKGSPHIELTFQYCTAGKYEEEFDLIHTCYINRLQGIASSLAN